VSVSHHGAKWRVRRIAERDTLITVVDSEEKVDRLPAGNTQGIADRLPAGNTSTTIIFSAHHILS
jgi:hypothetical protein